MTRPEIIELMARAMFPTVYDDARSKWQVTQRERKGTAYNKAKAALNALTAAGLAIVPIEPDEDVELAITKSAWWSGPGQDPANVWRLYTLHRLILAVESVDIANVAEGEAFIDAVTMAGSLAAQTYDERFEGLSEAVLRTFRAMMAEIRKRAASL